MSETATRTFPAASPAGAAICNALGVGVPARSADPEVSPSEKLVTIDQAAAMQFEPWNLFPTDGGRRKTMSGCPSGYGRFRTSASPGR